MKAEFFKASEEELPALWDTRKQNGIACPAGVCWGYWQKRLRRWNARAKSDGLLSHFVQEQKHTEATCKSIAAEKVELSKVHVCYHV